MCAYRAWRLIACSLALPLGAAAAPLQPGDVQRERQAIPVEIALEKAQALDTLRVGSNRETLGQLAAGISLIENKLQQLDIQTPQTRSELKTRALGERRLNLRARATARTYLTCRPTNSLAFFLDPKARKNLEVYLTASELEAGANILVPYKHVEVPACLSEAEVEQYLELRCTQKLSLGAYWRLLHRDRLSDVQLALLRYYEYLDLHAPCHPVLVYTCTTLRSGER